MATHQHHQHQHNSQEVIDPVCGMSISPADAVGTAEHNGQTFHFCSDACLQQFRANPEQFLGAKRAPVTPTDPEDEYTCPMHPEIRQKGPGSCPICGMALEPVNVTLEEQPNEELQDMTRRFWWSLALTIPILGFMVAEFLPGDLLHRLPAGWRNWIELALATPVVLWGGWPFFQRGWASARTLNLNMFTLIALGVGAAYGYSVIATLAPGLFPLSFYMGHEVAVYFEPAAVIVVLVLLGQVLELRARAGTSAAIRNLLGLAPKTARKLHPDGREEDIPVEHVHIGDRLRVRPGERVPVDGSVSEGATTIDESMVTGEPIPVEKTAEAKVTGGTVNGTGTFVMTAERVGAETLLAQIVRMVSEAQRSRAPIQRLADTVSGWFVPIVILVAIVTFVVWGFFGPEPRFAHALVNAVAVLIIACPCALGLATPMSIMVGTGRGAELGVLLRNAEALEVLEQVNTIVVDKTGTLTEGKPRLTTVEPAAGFDEATVLRLTASLENVSEHPLAAAIVAGARERAITLAQVQDFASTTGKGVQGNVECRQIAIGNLKFMESLNVSSAALVERADALRRDGQTIMLIAIDGKPAGLVGVADPIKESAREAIQDLQRQGVTVVMLTGDNRTTAEAVAKKVGIDQVEADVLP
ncbi:MAG TPA: heavy metal translocating P-type ATPase, partial [Mycobacterium sp.]|nr:heavy metal translocating P-type ATPase [Mycobacterium sp.]